MFSTDPVIKVREASIFQEDNVVLNGLNFEIAKGEFSYLVGRTGSGKSSLMRTLYGDLPLTQGEGHVCGFDLSSLTRTKLPMLRRRLGIVFQDFQLLTDRNVNENLRFVLKATGWHDTKGIADRIASVLEKVGLANKGYKMPHELSGGEQQRVLDDHPLLKDPEIIVSDEHTVNIDHENT